MRMLTVAVALAWLATGLCAPRPAAAEASERPNVIIFVADDMSTRDCGAYGHPWIRTPHMDRLARDGMRFTNAFLTISSCSPSRSSIMTGRYPHNTGAGELHLPLPADQTIMTQPLREAGYWTASVGKWHLGNAAKEQINVVRGGNPAEMGRAWVEALRDRPEDRPFFLWAAHTDPHRPYRDGTIEDPHEPGDVRVPPYLPDTPKVRDDLAAYYDEVSRFDQHVGMVLDELEKQGIAASTFVLVISDNGRPFPRCKTTVYDSGVQTPFIVRWPGEVEPGTVSRSVVSVVDIAPTVLKLAGLEPIDPFQGRSLLPVLRDPRAEVRRYAFAEHNWHDYAAYERAVRSGRWLYIRDWRPDLPNTPPADAVRSPTFRVMQKLHERGELTPPQRSIFIQPRPEEFLFDTKADPHQVRNLAGDPAYLSQLKKMRKAMRDWRRRTGDEYPGDEKLTPDAWHREKGTKLKEFRGAANPQLKSD